VWTRESISRRAVDWDESPFFSEAVGSVQLRWVSVKGYHIWGLPVGSVRVTYVDWCGKRTWRDKLSLVGCILIQIIAILEYE
jgi:hypothetical protein